MHRIQLKFQSSDLSQVIAREGRIGRYNRFSVPIHAEYLVDMSKHTPGAENEMR